MHHARCHPFRACLIPTIAPRPPIPARAFTVLALESSADDTCAAVVTSERRILSNVVRNQASLLETHGGIHPLYAIHAHQHQMPGVIQQALSEARLTIHDVDGIAFTRGPGMVGCLSVCATSARALAAVMNKPLVGVHHMQAHALTPFLTAPDGEAPEFPFLTLLVSGGHTMLLLATSPTQFRILVNTTDIAIGNAFDKAARALQIPLDGAAPGAALERFCAQPDTPGEVLPKVEMPRPTWGLMRFSYAGFASAIARVLEEYGGIDGMSHTVRRAVARSFQRATVAHLEEKISRALALCSEIGVTPRCMVVSGGVASNSFLRARMRVCLDAASPGEALPMYFPPPSLCTDNAAMIGWASMSRFLAGDTDPYSIGHKKDWSLEDLGRETGGSGLELSSDSATSPAQ
ncbi:glycoprotease [Epithele typhae]|uniref:glycoprotease n=1 Tax=Epithele typhae TaxID=378194 RepID=UPI002008BD11|nr:glycoprotease [Epithele typhae]KAH9939411.1 glycoprotease [Epithele typhae]